MIKAEKVSKKFQDAEALKSVSLSVQRSSIYGLVGSNGAGKTTLLKLLAGIYRQNSGEITIDAQPVFENDAVKARTVFIPDLLYFFPNFSIRDTADYYAQIYPQWNQARFEKLEGVFNIEAKRRIKTLSKGMQRQVSFWLSLALTPEVMLLDEPIDGLDPVMRQKVKNLIIQDVAEREMTVMISSHNLRDLEDICDYIGILHQGEMLMQKDLDDLKADVHKIQVAFSGETPPALLQDMQPLYQEKRGSVLILIVRGAYADIIKRVRSYQPAVLDILPLTLEEIFIYEMGDNGYEIKNILDQ
ncbi:ABC transporter ATP-binding protein [Pelotomaculum terephthalicicum JT]|uniref:ABC transporter ATP-binding protein n=1 Tax=Pelotomaculum terephthalicicum TaxID=206393 RepID=UPI001F034290|nr:ABC transporter ATP-binding protein [Pelotomaculum terephthalicicum]MCG9968957.1 ABC transporter ATP-binding protein [Pelotomaculum terephthalicicum JT]